jgi:tRNA (mo5U34)-methyltransferase
MKKIELQKKIDEIKWFHRLDLPTDEGDILTTPGEVDHTNEKSANGRYGLPLDLTGRSVLDVGAFDGYFSFLCEDRGANVSAIDPLQGRGQIREVFEPDGLKIISEGDEGFRLAHSVLNSKVKYAITDLKDFVNGIGSYSQRGKIIAKQFDLVLYYGVLYHVDSPIDELKYLFKTIKDGGMALIETAISQRTDYGYPFWEFLPGFDGADTNKWYPTIGGLQIALQYVGFKNSEVIYNDGIRATLRALK